jgi:BclB C-terminal domain-containing protein
LGGLAGDLAIVGAAANVTANEVAGVVIGPALNYAYSVPLDGTITAVSGYLQTTAALSIVGTTLTPYVQLYISSTPDNNFVPLGSQLVLGNITGVVNIGTIINARATGLNLAVPAQSRLLYVVGFTATGAVPIQTLTALVSGGLIISF